MRKFAGIIESAYPPNKQYIWLYKGVAKYFTNGIWLPISILETEEDNEDIIEDIPIIKISSKEEDLNKNKETLNSIKDTITFVKVLQVVETGFNTYLGIYQESFIRCFGKLDIEYYCDLSTGEITLSKQYDPSKTLPFIELELEDSAEAGQRNLERLSEQIPFVKIGDYYGKNIYIEGKEPTNIIELYNPSGDNLYYDIYPDGIVKFVDSFPNIINIYLSYLQGSNVKKPYEDFMKRFIDLIDAE